ncbi:hypothetical protein VNPA120719_56830 [Pseudomonas aeruginosa]|nr:hypothetical protein VNPA110516_22610 [Pseudomonas aeruginosa]GLE75429.1 hypothetical protein VNPA120641_22950 [Pseudomonas aeruginosa]GLE92287.1 hypothetical protein VNPA120719_56830 [Pseudomonas aeruginosa]
MLYREHSIDSNNYITNGFRSGCTSSVQEMIWLSNAQVLKEYLVELIVIILPGMDENMVTILVELRHYTREANDLGARTYYRDNL